VRLALAAAVLRSHDRIDPQRFFILGHSLGGTLAPRIAAEDRSLAGLIILAGTTRPLWRLLVSSLRTSRHSRRARSILMKVWQGCGEARPEAYWKDLDAYRPAQTTAALTSPMLILQGERDYQVALADLQEWRGALGGRANVTIKSYPH
jgi:uncharacterized protein